MQASAGVRDRSRRRDALDSLDFFGFQVEIEDAQVGPHVVRVGGSGQSHHADIEGESKDHLTHRPPMARGDLDQCGMGQCIAVGGQ